MPWFRTLLSFLRCRRGTVAVEFSILLPILLVASIGALELALIIFDFHRASEAIRRGARMAIIQPPLVDLDGLGSGTITCQSPRAKGNPDKVSVQCTSSGGATGDPVADSKTIFFTIMEEMREFLPEITPPVHYD